MPRAWVFLRRVWIASFTAALGLVIVLPMMCDSTAMPIRSSPIFSVQGWIFLSIATMLFLIPHSAHDVIVCSQRELRGWQFKSLRGSLLIGVASLIVALQCDWARWEWSVAVVCGVILLCLVTAPYFFRLSAWRVWGGIILILVGFAC
jgi:hypothetical protein